jgi:tetratricopeptide (TPR) repeat protein
MSYFALCLIGNAYRYMGETEAALFHYRSAEQFCPERNEHIMWMAEALDGIGKYQEMLSCTKRLMLPERKNPFPNKCFLLINGAYYDTGTYVSHLHSTALFKLSESKSIQNSAVKEYAQINQDSGGVNFFNN